MRSQGAVVSRGSRGVGHSALIESQHFPGDPRQCERKLSIHVEPSPPKSRCSVVTATTSLGKQSSNDRPGGAGCWGVP